VLQLCAKLDLYIATAMLQSCSLLRKLDDQMHATVATRLGISHIVIYSSDAPAIGDALVVAKRLLQRFHVFYNCPAPD